MEETEVVSEDTVVEDYETPVNPLVYVAFTLMVGAAGLAGYRWFKSRRRKNRLAAVEPLPAQDEASE